jgi:hypothetical protein
MKLLMYEAKSSVSWSRKSNIFMRIPLAKRHLPHTSGYIMAFNKIFWTPVRAGYALEQNNPGIRLGASAVMLSAAKHLAAQRDRPLAEFTLSATNGLRVTVEVSVDRPSLDDMMSTIKR